MFLVFTSFCFLNASAQQGKSSSQSEKEVRAVVDRLFEGMREGDSAKVHSVVHGNARFVTSYTNTKKEPMLQEGTLSEFLTAVGTKHDVVWDERIISCEIRVDDHIAQVWAHYEFYAGEKFSHCGVDAFQLVHDSTGWKILNLMDTRRTEGCR